MEHLQGIYVLGVKGGGGEFMDWSKCCKCSRANIPSFCFDLG